MSEQKYPRIQVLAMHPRNTSALCPCGALGKFKSCIEWNYMRGDDSVVWSCEQHKDDIAFLAAWEFLPKNN
jgi:hypothetical protein